MEPTPLRLGPVNGIQCGGAANPRLPVPLSSDHLPNPSSEGAKHFSETPEQEGALQMLRERIAMASGAPSRQTKFLACPQFAESASRLLTTYNMYPLCVGEGHNIKKFRFGVLGGAIGCGKSRCAEEILDVLGQEMTNYPDTYFGYAKLCLKDDEAWDESDSTALENWLALSLATNFLFKSLTTPGQHFNAARDLLRYCSQAWANLDFVMNAIRARTSRFSRCVFFLHVDDCHGFLKPVAGLIRWLGLHLRDRADFHFIPLLSGLTPLQLCHELDTTCYRGIHLPLPLLSEADSETLFVNFCTLKSKMSAAEVVNAWSQVSHHKALLQLCSGSPGVIELLSQCFLKNHAATVAAKTKAGPRTDFALQPSLPLVEDCVLAGYNSMLGDEQNQPYNQHDPILVLLLEGMNMMFDRAAPIISEWTERPHGAIQLLKKTFFQDHLERESLFDGREEAYALEQIEQFGLFTSYPVPLQGINMQWPVIMYVWLDSTLGLGLFHRLCNAMFDLAEETLPRFVSELHLVGCQLLLQDLEQDSATVELAYFYRYCLVVTNHVAKVNKNATFRIEGGDGIKIRPVAPATILTHLSPSQQASLNSLSYFEPRNSMGSSASDSPDIHSTSRFWLLRPPVDVIDAIYPFAQEQYHTGAFKPIQLPEHEGGKGADLDFELRAMLLPQLLHVVVSPRPWRNGVVMADNDAYICGEKFFQFARGFAFRMDLPEPIELFDAGTNCDASIRAPVEGNGGHALDESEAAVFSQSLSIMKQGDDSLFLRAAFTSPQRPAHTNDYSTSLFPLSQDDDEVQETTSPDRKPEIVIKPRTPAPSALIATQASDISDFSANKPVSDRKQVNRDRPMQHEERPGAIMVLNRPRTALHLNTVETNANYFPANAHKRTYRCSRCGLSTGHNRTTCAVMAAKRTLDFKQ